MKPPLTRTRAELLIETARMAAAEARMALDSADQLLMSIDPALVELHEGITKTDAPDIEVRPRIVRSV